jgi:hypothetical protein
MGDIKPKTSKTTESHDFSAEAVELHLEYVNGDFNAAYIRAKNADSTKRDIVFEGSDSLDDFLALVSQLQIAAMFINERYERTTT